MDLIVTRKTCYRWKKDSAYSFIFRVDNLKLLINNVHVNIAMREKYR